MSKAETLSKLMDLAETENTAQLLKLKREVEAKLFAAAKQGRLTTKEAFTVYNLARQHVRTTRPKAPNWSRN